MITTALSITSITNTLELLDTLTPGQRLLGAVLCGITAGSSIIVATVIAQSVRQTVRQATQAAQAARPALLAPVAQYATVAAAGSAHSATSTAADTVVRIQRLPVPRQFTFHQSDVALATVALRESSPAHRHNIYLSSENALLEPWCAIPEPLEPRWN